MSKLNAKNIVALYEEDEGLAFKLLFDTLYVPLVLFANKITQDKHAAEDIVQETLLSFWDKKKMEHVSGELDSYLFEAVKNKTLDFIKHNSRRQELHLAASQETDRNHHIPNERETQQYAKLYRAIALLPDKRREVFKLVYLEGYQYQEVADMLNISINTVQTQLRRSLQFLKEQLGHSRGFHLED